MRCLKVIAALMMLFALNTAVCFALEEDGQLFVFL